jgi:hypothetical protein
MDTEIRSRIKAIAIAPTRTSCGRGSQTKMFGTAGFPHILMRFFTVPSAKEARKSVFIASGFIGYFYLLTLIIGFSAITLLAGVSRQPRFDSGAARVRRHLDLLDARSRHPRAERAGSLCTAGVLWAHGHPAGEGGRSLNKTGADIGHACVRRAVACG